ncbi:hemagglutinin repeat-containing protein [Pusillimonas sp. SM2304]|uniref:hemagglutinin repeat-containing protein n=1 Tax=Pusillimonas sp. SM2304 TaxID=3073241 RepID=UPI002875AD90|nr:hemagglutinin repeat-containing protein [Pusillimonas sp. SM2304]MDS1140850.1 hemagglutinin repeat-containing protein [Pusillimonas sp. SM2304]
MNKNLYRIVFNRALSLLQVVAETARRDGPGASTGAGAAGSRFLAMLSPLRLAVALALGQAVIVPLANARVVADPNAPGNQRPTVLGTANGVPLVNIQTPSAAGVSRNTYRQFDIDQKGAILNNSRKNTQTQLGGWVQGNPWLGKGTARVILNEVNASDPSRLNGYIEVAGDRAQLVIANPAGISCDGCGFINANRATITTGKPIINGGSLEGYRVQGGAIRIHGQGMDASAANYTDLIARSVQANAGIWAQQLQVTTGANEVSAGHATVRKLAASGEAPAFALDVGALGGMYSQKIMLVGTEQGVGMRNAGTIGAQAGQLVVTADGRLENSGTMQAKTDTRIGAGGGVANTGTVSAGRELLVATPKDIDNRKGTLNARRIEAEARSLKNRGGAIEQTGAQDLALRASHLSNRDDGRIGLAATDTGTPPGNGSTLETGTNGETAGTGGGSPGGGSSGGSGSPGGGGQPGTGTGAGVAPLATGLLNIAATLDNDGGRIMAGGNIDVAASAGLDNAGGHLGARRLDVSGGGLDNRKGEIKVAADARIATGLLNNDAGLMQLAGPVAVEAQDFSNRAGTFQHSGKTDTRIQVKGRLDNSEGTIASNAKRLTLDAGQLLNTDGYITHAGDGSLQVNAGTLDNSDDGVIASTHGTLSVDSGVLNNAGGLLQSAQAMRVDTHGQALVNTDAGSTGGILSGGTLALNSGNLDNRGGVVHSQGDLVARSSGIDNRGGQLGSSASVDIGASTLGNGGGRILAGKDLTADLSGVADNNGGLMVAEDGLTVNAAQILNRDTQGADADKPLGLQGNTVALSANHIDNTAGAIAADSHIGIRSTGAQGVLDNTRGSVSSVGSIDVAINRVLNQAGTLLAGESLNVTADRLGGDGSLLSKGDLSLILQQDFTNFKEVTANGRALISTAGLLTNHSLLQAGDLEVRGANVNNTATGQMTGGRTTVAARDTLTNRGLIDGGQTRIDAGTLDNVGTGRIYGDHLAIQAGTLNNRDEADRAAAIAARQRLDIGANLINNREQALIFSAGGGSDALNIGGTLDANGQAAGRANLILNDSATIESLGGLTIDTRRLLNRNLHFSTKLVQVGGATQYLYIQPKGDPNKHNADEYRWESWSRAGRYRHKETGEEVRAWTQYDVIQTEYETKVTGSAPSMIRSGGNMTLRGDELVNDKSQIIAGGTLRGDLRNLKNEAVFGEHIIRETGTSQYTYSRWRGGLKRYHQRKWDAKIAYTPADVVETVALDISKVVQNASGGGSGFTVGNHQTGQVNSSVGGSANAAVEHSVRDPSLDGAAGSGANMVIQMDTGVPANSLFRRGPKSGSYLVETDPRFADYRNWLSSDYMLSQLGYDPATMHKRLGDGFYEQKLVRDQISQLTGRRFLDGYASDEAQYRALLEAGSTYAKAWNLRPGVALSAEQMAQLTSDIVWLVEREVTLSDGTTTRALVPQVYVRVKPGDLDGRGTLMAANAIDLDLKGDLVNSGTIAGRTAVKLTGENLRNLGGRITGDAVALTALTDIDNIGGVLDADSALLVKAGRDLNVASTTRSDAKQAGLSDFSRTHVDRVAGLYVSKPEGTLVAMAGRDVNLIAAQVINSGKDGQTAIVAGRDLTLGTVKVAEQENNVRNASNYLKQGYVNDAGTRIDTAGDVRLQAGRDLTATAANVTSDKGALVAVAQGDVDILAGEASSNWSEGRQHKSKNLLGSSKKTTRDSLEETTATASTFSGDTVAVQGQNVTVTGSNVVSDARTVIVAKNDLTIQAATETASESHFKETKKSGFLHNGGVAFTVGSQMQSGDRKDVSTRAAASTVGSTEGDVTLVAGNHYQQTGSHVLAPKGYIDIHASKVDIIEARETGASTQESKFRQSGLTVAVTSPVISAVQTGQQMKSASGNTSDTRMKALAAATTGLAAVNAYDAVSADPKAAGGLNLSVSVGSSKSDSKSTTTYDTAAGSTVAAGGDVRISATGAGQDSDLTVRGSTISAGGNAHLKADGDINLLAAKNTVETHRSSSSSSAGVGVAISVGQGGASMGITANASRGKGKGDGQDVTWTNTHVSAGNRLTLESGGDTHLRGAVASGKQVVADVGGNLNIESLQDTSTFKSKDSNVGGSVTVGAGFSGSASYAKSRVDADFASVSEQSGIQAGDGGFDVKVKGNTDLKGGVIASTDNAVLAGLNEVSTGTLTVSDIENRSKYKATGVSLSGGFSMSGDDKKANGTTNGEGSAKKSENIPASNVAGKGSEWSLQNFGNDASAGAPGYSKESGSDHSSTRSGISVGKLEIRDQAAQEALTGKIADETVASIDRDVLTGDSANGLTKNWDPDKLAAQVQAQAEIAAAFSQQAYSQMDRYVQRERAELQAKLKDAKTPEEKSAVESELRDLKLQERAMNVLIGAVTGSGVSAVTKETLSAAASEMRRLMIEDSMKFAGITDGSGDPLSNISGTSAGVNGDEKKIGGTRVDLDIICGAQNKRCVTNPDGSLQRDENNMVKFDIKETKMTLAQFLKTDEGKKASGATGGIQGAKGTLFGIPYSPGSLADKVVEAFAGTHDMIGGKLSGLYDKDGNATRDRSKLVSNAQATWSIVAIAPAAPFAMSEALPKEVWQAISTFLKASR